MGNNISKRKVLTYPKYLKKSEDATRNKKKRVPQLQVDLNLIKLSTPGTSKFSGKVDIKSVNSATMFEFQKENFKGM